MVPRLVDARRKMDETAGVRTEMASVSQKEAKGLGGRRLQGFGVFLAALSLAYAFPLFQLFSHAAHNELYSHAFLIPGVTIYLAIGRLREANPPLASHWALALTFALAGAAFLGVYLCASTMWGWNLARVDQLALTTASYLAFATGGLFLFLGAAFLRAILFPWALLLFLVPFPEAVEGGVEIFFQRTSADVAQVLMSLAGLPVFRDGLFFRLPGILLEVARECSGIRSSLVLFITSLVGGLMLLRRPWSRAFLALAVIPLAILRNAFRILTIAWLCVHIGPEMIHSPIHRRGGPIFFLLSLVPFFALLLFLKWIERRRPERQTLHESN